MTSQDGLRSLGRAVGLLATAADRSQLAGWDLDRPAAFRRDTAVNEALWIALDLLPTNIHWTPAAVDEPGVLPVLEQVERELRCFPIEAYPPGSSRLVAAVCDLVRTQPCLG